MRLYGAKNIIYWLKKIAAGFSPNLPAFFPQKEILELENSEKNSNIELIRLNLFDFNSIT